MPKIADYRGIPAARQINDLLLALDHSNKVRLSMGGGSGAPSVWAQLGFVPNHTYDDMICVGRTGVGYKARRGAIYTYETITGSIIENMHSQASAIRLLARIAANYTGDFSMHGNKDLRLVQAGDLAYSGGPINPPGLAWSQGGPMYDDLGNPTEDPAVGAQRHGMYKTLDASSSAAVPKSLFPTGHNQITEISDFAGLQGAYCDSAPDNPSDPGEAFWHQWPFNPTGIGYNHGPAGEGTFEHYPITFPSPVFAGSNVVGGFTQPYEIGGNIINEMGAAAAKIDCTGTPMPYPWFLANCPPGTVINECKMDIKPGTLTRSHWEFIRLSYDPDVTPVLDVDYTYSFQQTTENVGLSIMSQRIDEAGGGYWDIKGNAVGGTMVPGKWNTVDGLGVMRTILSLAMNSKYNRNVAIMPSPFAGLIEAGDMRSILRAMCPIITWAYYTDPDWTTALANLDPPLEPGQAWMGGRDAVYMASNSGSNVQWDGLELGDAVIDVTYPSGANHTLVYNINMPPVHV